MRVFIVCDFGDVSGGAARVAIDSAVGLAEAGVKVTYVYAIAPESAALDHRNITRVCLAFPSVWEQSNPLTAALQGIWNAAALKRLAALVSQHRDEPRIVHLHQWSKAFSPSILAIGASVGVPVVVSLHDYFIACPNGAYYQFGAQRPCALRPLSAGCIAANCDSQSRAHKMVRVVRQYATRRAAGRAPASINFLSVSPLAERVIETYLPKAARRFVVRSPVGGAREQAADIGLESALIYVGRLTEEKGVRALVHAAQKLGMPLTLVGTGPLYEEMKAAGGVVRCTGWLTAEAVAAEMRRARALIFPSTWHETGGLVVLEALARGVPVVVSTITGVADLIEHGENGFLIDPFDPAALRECLGRLRDTETARRMGQEAYRRYWQAPFTTDRHAAELMDVYRTVLSDEGTAALASGE